jgi:hypothetical protein
VNKRIRVYAVISVVIILFGLFILSLPQERLLLQEEYTDLEFFPMYYYANFTVTSSDTNAELGISLGVDVGGNYSSYMTFWMLYQLLPEQFEEHFNITEAYESLSGEEWTSDAFWAGGGLGDFIFPIWDTIPTGAYVFVFWIQPDGPTTTWSATLAVSLRTSVLPRA